MTRAARVAACALGLICLLFGASIANAADQKAIIDQIKAHNQAATTAYGAGKFDQMKTEAQAAITLAGDNGVTKHATLAQAYVLLGVAEVESKHRDAGISAFVKALGISAAAEVPDNMNKKAVKAAFSKAEDQDATATKEEPPAPKPEKADSKDKEKQAAETAEKDKAAQAEHEKQSKDLAAAKESENKAQAAREKLAKEKQDSDKQLGDAKSRIAELQKEKTDKEQELTATKTNEKKEHEAREKLEKAKLETDKQLADMKARVAQLEKDNADKDRQLTSVRDSEKKEREAREKLEKVTQEADAREKDRKAREDKESADREKLAEGPEVPKSFAEPIHCTIPDEAPAAADLYVHCVAKPSVGAKLLVFYYRPVGVVPFNAVLMDTNKKGWSVATIPGRRISGKYLHYYIEARDAHQEVAATNGKPTSPNVLTVLPAGTAVASQTPANDGLKPARATEKGRKRTKTR